MYARLFTAFVQPDKSEEFPVKFAELLLSGIGKEPGFKSVYMMKDAEHDKFVVLVLWETESGATASTDHYLRERLPTLASFLVAQPSSETLEVVLRA
ncbi:MAG TPA: antibiotic biosynthesis monooxygenase [Chloroflexia bacterium]|nr:antibiotic biosynthesis monooxygenase [Chloroflexia bacterium]